MKNGVSRMYEVDVLLPGERFRSILKDLANGKYESIEKFIDEFSEYAEYDTSDAFVHKMMTICRFLIDIKAYKYVRQILELSSIIGIYESESNEGEECVITYAIRKIEDENIIVDILKNFDGGGGLAVYLFGDITPSMVAIDQKKYITLKLLFEKKLCTEKLCYGRCTALQYAVDNKDYEFAELLLTEFQHDPDLYGINDIPPIALAANLNDFRMVELLIKHRANVSAIDGNGRTAICYCRSDKMIEIFKSNGAIRENLQMRTISRIISDIRYNGYVQSGLIKSLLEYEKPLFCNMQENIIILAARYGDVNALLQLSKHMIYAQPDELIRAAFDWYVLDGVTHHKNIDKLIELTNVLVDAKVRCQNPKVTMSPFRVLSMRPEMFLKTTDEKAFVLFDNVIKLGYSLGEEDFQGRNVFHTAISNLNMSLIKYCLCKGMKYEHLDTEEISAIELLLGDSASREFKEANTQLLEHELQILIANGCNINHQDKSGFTPLHKLVKEFNFKEYPVKLLLKNHANLFLENNMKDTAYDIAERRKLPDRILKLLKPQVIHNDKDNRGLPW